jgi:recombination protein RecT
MSTAAAVGKELAKTDKPKDLRTLINESAKELSRALPAHMKPERLVRIALTCVRTNPDLALCTPESFLGALFVAAQIGVEPVAGQAYILPFNNKRKVGNEWRTIKEAQFILGYKGLGSLFYRHEKAVQLSWGIVHRGDDFSYEYGTNSSLKHIPAKGDRGPVEGYYVVAQLAGGGKPFMYMTREECLAHGRKHSKTYDRKTNTFYSSSPWATNEDAMCLKTVLIQLGKLLPLSVEIQSAIAADETSREYRKGIDSALDLTPTTDWSEAIPAEVEKSDDKKPEAQEEGGGSFTLDGKQA